MENTDPYSERYGVTYENLEDNEEYLNDKKISSNHVYAVNFGKHSMEANSLQKT